VLPRLLLASLMHLAWLLAVYKRKEQVAQARTHN